MPSRDFIVIAQTMAGLCSFALARRFLPVERGALWRGVLCGKSYALLIVYMRSDFFLAGIAGVRADAAGVAEGVGALWAGGKSPRLPFAGDGVVRDGVAGVWLSNAPAGVMATYGAALLFAWAVLAKKSFASLAMRRGRIGIGFWIDEFLSFARRLRATLGEYRAGAFARLATLGQLSLHDGQRSRT